MITDRQIAIQNNKQVAAEAARLFRKYGSTAALKALYRAQSPGDFYDQVSIQIMKLERA